MSHMSHGLSGLTQCRWATSVRLGPDCRRASQAHRCAPRQIAPASTALPALPVFPAKPPAIALPQLVNLRGARLHHCPAPGSITPGVWQPPRPLQMTVLLPGPYNWASHPGRLPRLQVRTSAETATGGWSGQPCAAPGMVRPHARIRARIDRLSNPIVHSIVPTSLTVLRAMLRCAYGRCHLPSR